MLISSEFAHRLIGLSLCLFAACCSPCESLLADDDAPTEATESELPPLEVPDGFTIELVAGPPLVKYPMMAAFDERGRLFIAESDGQNLGKDALLEQEPRFVRLIEDTDGDGKFDKSTIYADKMVMPEGALCHNGTFYIVSAPYLWRLDDTDGDGVADHREQLVGEMDLIGNPNQHGPYLTPAGRLLFTCGTFGYNLVPKDGKPPIKGNWASVFSCKPDGSDVRVESQAGINPVEVEFAPEGEMLGTCAIFDRVGGRCDALVHWVHGGLYAERLREPNLQQTGRFLPAAVRWGQVAPAGLVRMRGSHFGEEFRGNLFACLFNTHELIRIRVERSGATFRGEHEVFLRSPSSNFHPADILEDADGSLLLINTGAWLTMGCPLSKDGTPGGFGGIYRIRKTDGPLPADPRGKELDWTSTAIDDLIDRLDDSRPAVCDHALSKVVERGDKAVAALAKAALTAESMPRRRNAVWALSRIGTPPARAALCAATSDSDASVRQAIVHALGILQEPAALQSLMKIVVEDELPIRREAATALGLIGDAQAVPALLDSLHTAKDEFLEHALIYAVIEIGDIAAVQPGLKIADPRVQRGALIALDQIDGESLTQDAVAPLLAVDDAELQRAALDVIAKHPTWADEIVGLLRQALAAKKPTAGQQAILSGAVTAFAANGNVQSLVAEALNRPGTPSETLLALLEAIGRTNLPAIPESWIKPLGKLLAHADENVRRQLLAGLIPFNAQPLEGPLRSLAKDRKQSNGARIAALALAVRHGVELGPEELSLVIEQVQSEATPIDRLAAANVLTTAHLSAGQLNSLLPVVRQAGPLELPALLRAYELSAKAERIKEESAQKLGSELLDSLAQSPGLNSLPPARIHAIFAVFPEAIAQAAKKRFPEVSTDNEAQLAKLNAVAADVEQGRPDLGKHLFQSKRLACAGCHRISGQGGMVGPDLSQVAKIRTVRQLAEAVLSPSATLTNGFESYTLAMQSGQVLTGLIRRETAEAVQLVTTDGNERRVLRTEIAEITPSAISVMPQGLDRQLTAEELRDLIAFLTTLK